MWNADVSPITKVVPLQTFYKSDSNTDSPLPILKFLKKTHKQHLQWRQLSVYLWTVDWKAQIALKELFWRRFSRIFLNLSKQQFI